MQTRRAAPHRINRRQRWQPSVAALLLALSLALGMLLPDLADSRTVRADEVEPTATETIAAAQDDPTAAPTETATPEPTATETPAPEPTATDVLPTPTPVQPTITATSTPEAPTATTQPSATATPTDGPVELEFVESDVRADPGAKARFELIVRNGDVPQTIDLATSSTNDWTIQVFRLETDGMTARLTDSDGDDRVDLGRVGAGQELRAVITVAVPEETLAGTEDTLTVRVPGRPGERATLTVNPVLLVDLSGSASFGTVNMLGTVDRSIPGLTSVPDSEGATYIRAKAVRIEVTSNAPWNLSCSLAGASTELTERGSGLAWRFSGTESWNQFARGEDGPICASGKAGTTVFELDLRMRVDLADTAETLRGTIHFSWDN